MHIAAENEKTNAMVAESMSYEAQYQHLATKADLERLGKELGEKINQQPRWFAIMWMTSIVGLAGLILSRPA